MLVVLALMTLSFQDVPNPFDSNRINEPIREIPIVKTDTDSADNTAALVLSQTISEIGEQSGMVINSISSRKPTELEGGAKIQRTYIGYDANYSTLLNFVSALDNLEQGVGFETLNISARRKPRLPQTTSRSYRAAFNGNAIIRSYTLDGQHVDPPEAESQNLGTHWVRELIEDLGSKLPRESYLASLVIKNQDVTFQGYAKDLDQVKQALSSLEILRDVREGNIAQSNDGDLTRFILKASTNFQ